MTKILDKIAFRGREDYTKMYHGSELIAEVKKEPVPSTGHFWRFDSAIFDPYYKQRLTEETIIDGLTIHPYNSSNYSIVEDSTRTYEEEYTFTRRLQVKSSANAYLSFRVEGNSRISIYIAGTSTAARTYVIGYGNSIEEAKNNILVQESVMPEGQTTAKISITYWLGEPTNIYLFSVATGSTYYYGIEYEQIDWLVKGNSYLVGEDDYYHYYLYKTKEMEVPVITRTSGLSGLNLYTSSDKPSTTDNVESYSTEVVYGRNVSPTRIGSCKTVKLSWKGRKKLTFWYKVNSYGSSSGTSSYWVGISKPDVEDLSSISGTVYYFDTNVGGYSFGGSSGTTWKSYDVESTTEGEHWVYAIVSNTTTTSASNKDKYNISGIFSWTADTEIDIIETEHKLGDILPFTEDNYGMYMVPETYEDYYSTVRNYTLPIGTKVIDYDHIIPGDKVDDTWYFSMTPLSDTTFNKQGGFDTLFSVSGRGQKYYKVGYDSTWVDSYDAPSTITVNKDTPLILKFAIGDDTVPSNISDLQDKKFNLNGHIDSLGYYKDPTKFSLKGLLGYITYNNWINDAYLVSDKQLPQDFLYNQTINGDFRLTINNFIGDSIFPSSSTTTGKSMYSLYVKGSTAEVIVSTDKLPKTGVYETGFLQSPDSFSGNNKVDVYYPNIIDFGVPDNYIGSVIKNIYVPIHSNICGYVNKSDIKFTGDISLHTKDSNINGSNKIKYIGSDPEENIFGILILEDDCEVYAKFTGASGYDIQASVDGVLWYNFGLGTEEVKLGNSYKKGSTMYFKKGNAGKDLYNGETSKYLYITPTKRYTVFGDMSKISSSTYLQCYLFNEETNLANARDLIASSDYRFYGNMFYGCTNLISAMNGQTLKMKGRGGTSTTTSTDVKMFEGCSKLRESPKNVEFSARYYSYYFHIQSLGRMFYNCTNLAESPTFSVVKTGGSSTDNFWYDRYALRNMFYGCTNLINIGGVNGIIEQSQYHSGGVYYSMFSNCGSIEVSNSGLDNVFKDIRTYIYYDSTELFGTYGYVFKDTKLDKIPNNFFKTNSIYQDKAAGYYYRTYEQAFRSSFVDTTKPAIDIKIFDSDIDYKYIQCFYGDKSVLNIELPNATKINSEDWLLQSLNDNSTAKIRTDCVLGTDPDNPVRSASTIPSGWTIEYYPEETEE